jgi:Domain of unknown function (DUF222)
VRHDDWENALDPLVERSMVDQIAELRPDWRVEEFAGADTCCRSSCRTRTSPQSAPGWLTDEPPDQPGDLGNHDGLPISAIRHVIADGPGYRGSSVCLSVSVAADSIKRMNESGVVSSEVPQAQRLAGWVAELAELPDCVDDDAARIDVIAELERLKAAVAATQVRLVEAFAVSQETADRALGFEARAARRGVPEQVGLARRVSPTTASRQVTTAKTLVREMPRVLGLLQAGEISEFVTAVILKETSVLSAEDRRAADEQLAPQLLGLGPKRAMAAARRIVIALDQQAVVDRAANARKDRRVGCRPAADTMAVLSALLPCEDGVRAYATLRAHADTLKAGGDTRSRDQIMADELVQRITGQAPAVGGPVEIGLIMNGHTLFAGKPRRRFGRRRAAGTRHRGRCHATPGGQHGCGGAGRLRADPCPDRSRHHRPRRRHSSRHRSRRCSDTGRRGVHPAAVHRPGHRNGHPHRFTASPVHRRAGGLPALPRPALPNSLL